MIEAWGNLNNILKLFCRMSHLNKIVVIFRRILHSDDGTIFDKLNYFHGNLIEFAIWKSQYRCENSGQTEVDNQ